MFYFEGPRRNEIRLHGMFAGSVLSEFLGLCMNIASYLSKTFFVAALALQTLGSTPNRIFLASRLNKNKANLKFARQEN